VALQFEHDGWLSPRMPEFFTRYAEVCFEHFGDRVKNWITLNEPWVTAILGYGQGIFAPGRTSRDEPYRVAHHQLLAHARAVERYRQVFQAKQEGRIGISNNCDWREPLTEAPGDREAAQRSLEFFLGWFADPVFLGDYPEVMRRRLGSRLPAFTVAEKRLLHGSSDFFGLNHYTTLYAADSTGQPPESTVYGNGGIAEDQDVRLSADPAWQRTTMEWAIVPWGCRKLLEWIRDRYGSPEVVVTENGCSFPDRPVGGTVEDPDRIAFLDGYLRSCHEALVAGVNLTGYFVWSMMDNFEWALGYSRRFGLHYVDFQTGLRIPKSSALWYREVIGRNGLK
jgi:beta-glucosidase